jgi:cell division control protein 42
MANKFIHEVRLHSPDVPCILVGTKIDLRNDVGMKQKLMQKQTRISYEEGEFMAKKLGCLAYFEISSMWGDGIEELAKGILGTKAISKKTKKIKTCRTQ